MQILVPTISDFPGLYPMVSLQNLQSSTPLALQAGNRLRCNGKSTYEQNLRRAGRFTKIGKIGAEICCKEQNRVSVLL